MTFLRGDCDYDVFTLMLDRAGVSYDVETSSDGTVVGVYIGAGDGENNRGYSGLLTVFKFKEGKLLYVEVTE